ncbi:MULTISPECIES: ROK family protein [Actinosynnema]|uniref:ROK family transcriptional regulator n=1 Tax=Actinosynnema TaxID=40566 RepID=UPI0020A42C86|nr:ROK family protein [Actinosynnema pretiosum]MCP2097435.1 Sugar kinase of the NBD/HSP70 family, may containing an N-terminal HTH domain [Actinosynnema pretiosum]
MTTSGAPRHARDALSTRRLSVREANTVAVLRAIMVLSSASQARLARWTGLSQATVSGAVARLQQNGLVEVGPNRDERGNRVRCAPMIGAAVGIELAHDRVVVALRRVDGGRVLHQSSVHGAGEGKELWAGTAVAMVDDLLDTLGMDRNDIVSLGLGVPTPVEHQPPWEKALIEYLPDVQAVVDNLGNMAAFGEYLHGTEHDDDVLLLAVHASHEVDAGLVFAGRVWRGASGHAAALGHIPVEPAGKRCRCGNRGCLETLISGPHLIDQVRQAHLGRRSDLPTILDDLVTRVHAGERVYARVIQDAGHALGRVLGEVFLVVNVDTVVLGGDLGRAGDVLAEAVRRGWTCTVPASMETVDPPVRLRTSRLGRAAAASGALAFALADAPSGWSA